MGGNVTDTIFNTILLAKKILKNVLSHAHTRMQHFEKMIDLSYSRYDSGLGTLTLVFFFIDSD